MERQPVDLVVDNIDWLVTVDADRRVLREAAVAVDGGRIVAVDKREAIAQGFAGRRELDASGSVVTPGFIDCHLHTSFQLSRGLADEANAREFLVRRMYPYESALTASDVACSARLAAREMLLHGTTCFVDPGNYHPDATADALGPTGIRSVISRSVFDQGGSDFGQLPDNMVTSVDQARSNARDLIDRYQGRFDDRMRCSVSFRGLNNASDELIVALAEVARDKGTLLQTHACFNYSTHDASVSKFGVPEIERLHRLGVLDAAMLIVHAGWLEPHEVELLRQSGANVVAAPSSSMHNGYGNIEQGQIPELIALGVNVGLGTDHACSGPVDLTQEMFLAACGYKEVRINPRVMPPETALEMATINGARAIGRQDLGSIEVGKKADLVLFDTTDPAWLPLYNPVSNLVYSATGRTVTTVLVDGREVVSNGRLVMVDDDEIVGEARQTSAELYERMDGGSLIRSRWPIS